MEEIIIKSIKGGWIPRELLIWDTLKNATEVKTYFLKYEKQIGINYILGKNVCGARCKISVIDKSVMILDPLFWQALGKACGWGVKIGEYTGDVHVNHEHNNGKCTSMCVIPSVKIALHFHEINLTEGWSAAIDYLRSICGLDSNE